LNHPIVIPSFLKKYINNILGIFILQSDYTGDAIKDFRSCLNSVHPHIQFTVEKEKDNQIPFLDCLLHRLPNGQVVTSVYHEPTEMNIITKVHSCHNIEIILGAFKTALCRARRICSSSKLRQKEIDFLLDVWEDNGFERKKLLQFSNNYRPPPTDQDIEDEVRNLVLAPEWAYHINNNTTIYVPQPPSDQPPPLPPPPPASTSTTTTATTQSPSTGSSGQKSHHYSVSLPFIPGVSHAFADSA
jgi:hypothetical protein